MGTDNEDNCHLHCNRSREVLIFSNSGLMFEHAAGQWERISKRAVRERGRFTVALSGGRTPAPLYRMLSEKGGLPWDRTLVFMADERFVPYESKESNYRMISSAMLQRVNIPANNIHPVPTTAPSPQEAAEAYEKDLRAYFDRTDNGYQRFDLILLGIGSDGHTASLFPGDPSLEGTERLCIAVPPPDRTGQPRITLALPVINNADNVIFIAAGESKAGVIREILEGDSLLPAALVRPEGNLVFLLDQDAGSQLRASR